MIGYWGKNIFLVTEILSNVISAYDPDDKGVCELWHKEISPIPLTEKVLEACGFKIDVAASANFWFNEQTPESYLYNSASGFSFKAHGISRRNKVEYLHDLQNIIYAWEGSELQIDLEKLKEAVK